MSTDQIKITIEYLPIAPEQCSSMILLEIVDPKRAHATKLHLLAKLGITPRDNEMPQQAWLRYLSELNGVPFTQPCDPAIAQGINEIPDAQRLMWVLTECKPKTDEGARNG